MDTTSKRRRKLGRRAVIVAAVVGVHAAVLGAVGLMHPEVLPVQAIPPILLELVPRPVPPPPPPPPSKPAPTQGGGAPAAPSVVHTPPKVRPVPREVPAPPVKAPEQPLVVGNAPIATPSPGMGQGGQGTGTGTGTGDGDGPGSGGMPPMIIRRATSQEIIAYVPPQARRARQAGRAGVRCEIQLDTTLQACVVLGETPGGFGFGPAAVQVVERYSRFRPPLSADGRPMRGQRVTVTVEFGRQSQP